MAEGELEESQKRGRKEKEKRKKKVEKDKKSEAELFSIAVFRLKGEQFGNRWGSNRFAAIET